MHRQNPRKATIKKAAGAGKLFTFEAHLSAYLPEIIRVRQHVVPYNPYFLVGISQASEPFDILQGGSVVRPGNIATLRVTATQVPLFHG